MDIRQIRYLVAAVEGKSLSAAAKRHFVTVQAVSKGIAELEHEVGTPLLVRGNHGVKPTAIGLSFYQRAKKTLDSFCELEDFVERVPAAHSDKQLLIAFCAPPFEGGDKAMGRLAKLLGLRLGIKIDILIAPGSSALEALRSRSVDALCMIGEFSAPDTDCVSIGSLPTGIGMTASHPLARRRTVRLADLAPYPILWSESFDSFNRSIYNVYAERGIPSPIVRVAEDGSLTPTDADIEQALYFSVYLSPFGRPFRESRVVPFEADEMENIPICLITLKDGKSKAYLTLERQLGSVLKVASLLRS